MTEQEAKMAMMEALDFVSSITKNEDGAYTLNIIDDANVEHNFTTVADVMTWLAA